MNKLDITKIEVQNGLRTVVAWHRYNTENQDNNSTGNWVKEGVMTNDEVLAYAKTAVDADIEVALNFEPLPDVVNPA